jgi:hypothetical protein
MRRLAAEEIRDSILAVSGELDLETFGGPSVYPLIPHAVLKGQSRITWKRTSAREHNTRRTVYTFVKRSLVDPFVEILDAATTDTSCAVRFQTTQPTQALMMLNSAFLDEAARKLAVRIKQAAGNDRRRQVALALELATSRKPDDRKIRTGLTFLDSFPDPVDPDQALQQFCLLVLNLNELVFVD